MNVEILSILKEAHNKKIKIGVNDNNLTIRSEAPINSDLLQKIKDNKVSLIKYIEKHSFKNRKSILTEITSYDRDSFIHIPLSFSQERLWFLDQLQGSTEYHIPTVLRLEGSLDVRVLEQTLQEIVSRHEVLRTLLLSEEGVGYQEVISGSGWLLESEDISSEELLEGSLVDYLGRPFDLSLDYKLRACLYRLGDDQYVLACVFHHIASDGWSGGILVNEFMELYNSFKSGRSAVLADLPLQYADYAIWQREYLQGPVLDSQLLYWEEKLRGVSTLSLPTDYVRPSVQSNSGSSISFELNGPLRDSLVSLCREQGVTLFMVLLSAFKVLLSRYSGQDDICVGTPIANRTQSELEGMIGFFVNTLALRSDLSGNPGFRELLSHVKQTTLESYDHQLVPFEKVVERVITSRDMSSSPLFQVLFSLQNNEEGKDLDLDGITISNYEFETVTAQFDLTLSAAESHQGISLSMNYCRDLFDSSTIERMLVHYQELLNSIVQDIDQPLGSLKILSKTEQEQLLHAFNDTYVAYPQDKTVVDLFQQQVDRTPDAVAVVYEGEELSYRELDNKSNQLAHYLRDQGVGPDALVGICLERSLEMLIGIMGILKSGGAYVPVDPSYPKDRIDYILDDGGIGLVLSSSSSSKVVNERTGLSVLSLDSDWDIISGFSSEKPVDVLSADNLAYVMYTSGTTGNPKGVTITHSNIINLCKNCDYIVLNSDTVWLPTGSISFDATTIEFFGTLLNGGQLVLVDTDTLLSTDKLKQLIANNGVNTLWMTASWFHQIVENDISVFECLRYLLVGGDIVMFNYTNKLIEIYPDLHIINGYGPTEHTTFSAVYNIDKITHRSIPIGKPIANTQIYILDSSLQLVPIGVAGELCISGDGLARGYLNNPELTSEKFVSNPFIAGERIYRTGDLARWLPDGNLEFMGRRDDQVKIRGYRIELGEIESALIELSHVRQAVVLAQDDLSGGKRLVGYVVSQGNFDKELVQDELRLRLPDYMVPMLWVSLDAMPLTSNGKIDKKALPEPDGSGFSGREYVAPRNKTEEQLAVIWQELLGIDPIGIHDNFFELGGHSLLATRLVSMIRKELSVELSIREVFTHSSIGALCSHLSVHSEGSLLPAVSLQARSSHIPLSFSQERLWFLDQLQGSTEYHIPTVLRLEGSLDVRVLEQTLQEIVSRHEVLRTLLLSEEGVGYQEVISGSGWLLESEDISSEELLEGSLVDYLGRPFDLSLDYKLRACLYRLGDDQYVLACVFHHIASDGWSGGILVNEFMELYNSFKSGRSAVLADLPLQYADYAIWQREYLQGPVLDSQLLYWEEKLRGVSTLSLPTDYVRPSVQSNSGSSISFELNGPLRDSLVSLCREQGVTLFMVLLSAFKVLLSRYSGQDDICVGTPIANRTQSELEGMIGFFVNTLALRSDLSGNPGFRELLSHVKQTTLESYDHQLVPFEKVVERVITSRDMSSSPLFQVLFSLQNNEEGKDLDLDGITISNYEFETVTAQFDLTLSAAESHQGISLSMNYCRDLFDSSTIERMLVHYQELLNSIVQDIDQPLGSLKILSKTEQEQLLHAFNDTYVAYPQDKTVVDLFQQQVDRTPDAVAVVYEGEELSYRELDNKSNQLAHYLKQNYNLKSDDIVGLMLDRSIWSIISILGILKSGTAYLPIDKDYPDERKLFIVNDADIKLLIIDSESLFEVIDYNVPVFSIDIEFETVLKEDLTVLNKSEIISSNLAYVIYTSGSTGRPKGVMISHGSLINYLLYSIDRYGSDDGCYSFPLFSSLSFDLTQTSIYLTLLTGGQLHVYTSNDVSTVLKAIALNEVITSIKLTPAHLSLFGDIDVFKLKRFIIGGEQLTSSDLNNLGELDASVRLFNEYGPTEATIGCSVEDVTDYNSLNRISIGKPIANTQIYILDSSLQLVPIGVAGELCIGGVQVARGYLNNPELTSEKFVSNPFIAGERIYRTGDLARWLPDGNLEFMGRRDDQVKIRGYRIELGEIESALIELSHVRQAVVLAQDDLSGGKRLVGYVVSQGNFDKELVQDELRLRLPDYMVPMLWVSLDAMPLTSNGKIDKKALPEPDGSGFSGREYVAPRNKTEEQLAVIWQELLGIDPIGIHDNFFELGGHSLLVLKLTNIVNEKLGTDFSINSIFQYPTIFEFIGGIEFLDYSKYKLMIALQEKGNSPAIYLAPPASGTANCYIELVKSLGINQPVYAFQCKGLDGQCSVSSSIEEMASEFIIEMQTVDPYGPYRLGGFSFGARVVYEMAFQLEKMGFYVEELLIFDGMVLFEEKSTINQDRKFREFLMELTDTFGEDFNWPELIPEGKSKKEQIQLLGELLENSKYNISKEELKGRLEVDFANENYSYLPKNEIKLDTRIILFKAGNTLIKMDDKIIKYSDLHEVDYGWNQYVNKEVVVHIIPCTHTDILNKEHVEKISYYLK